MEHFTKVSRRDVLAQMILVFKWVINIINVNDEKWPDGAIHCNVKYGIEKKKGLRPNGK